MIIFILLNPDWIWIRIYEWVLFKIFLLRFKSYIKIWFSYTLLLSSHLLSLSTLSNAQELGDYIPTYLKLLGKFLLCQESLKSWDRGKEIKRWSRKALEKDQDWSRWIPVEVRHLCGSTSKPLWDPYFSDCSIHLSALLNVCSRS